MRGEQQSRKSGDVLQQYAAKSLRSSQVIAKAQRSVALRVGERDAFLLMISDRLGEIVDPRAIMAVACEQLGEHLVANGALYGEMEDGEHLVVHQHYFRDVPSIAGTYRLEELGPSLIGEARAGRELVIIEVASDPRLGGAHAHCEAMQIRSGIAIPLVKGGRLRAVFGIYQREPRIWDPDEMALVRDVAERTWTALERATAALALRGSEERLRLALEATGTGTFLWLLDTNRVEANAQLFELCDVPPEAASSLPGALRDRIHPEDRARFDESQTIAMDPAGTGAFRIEFRVVRSTGEVRWIAFAGQFQFKGVPPRAVGAVGTAVDITERKQAEAVLALAARRGVFRAALADALRPLAPPNHVRRAACRLLNHHLAASRTFYAEIELGGEHFVVDEDETNGATSLAGRHQLEDVGDAVLALLRQGRVVVINNIDTDARVDPTARSVQTRYLAVASIAVPLIKEGRLAASFVVNQSSPRAWTAEEVAVVEDTADRTWAAVERARIEQELRDSNRRKDEFLAILAHELRNPLAPFRNALEVMRLAPHNHKTLERAREIMTRQLAQMIRLVEDLLDVSRINRGKVQLRRERINLEPILKQAVETTEPLLQAARQRLTTNLPDEPIWVDADPARLAQLFANLLNNAAKYSESGGEIFLSAERQGEWAVVHVRDTGIGILPEMLPRVFDMFMQEDGALEKARGGLGVGLSLVKGFVELHGGTVEAHSEGRGRGSEFVVRLPIVPSLTSERTRRLHKKPAATGARRRILIVDDNRDAALSLATVLKALKYRTQIAFDGLDAIKAAAEFRPSIVLLDIGMPRLNGYDACRRMRKRAWGRKIVIVALTGWGREADQERSKAAGFDFHLVKPVDPNALSRLLTSLPSLRQQ
jgi:PAS domain S-box-containing protein